MKKTLKQIAFFDFDGTITTRDTLLEFIKFTKGRFNFYLGFILYSPFLVAYKLKIISNQSAKEKILGFFFKNMTVESFDEKGKAFVTEKLPALLRPKALAEIRDFQDKGIRVVIVSASPENWIRPWTEQLRIELMATCLDIRSGVLTGKIKGNNCHGNEKVRRINESFILSAYDKIYTFGDTSGDIPMLNLGTTRFYKPFR